MLIPGMLVKFRPRYVDDYIYRGQNGIWPGGYNSSGVMVIELSDKDIGLYISKHDWKAHQVIDQEYLNILIGETIVIVRKDAVITYSDNLVKS